MTKTHKYYEDTDILRIIENSGVEGDKVRVLSGLALGKDTKELLSSAGIVTTGDYSEFTFANNESGEVELKRTTGNGENLQRSGDSEHVADSKKISSQYGIEKGQTDFLQETISREIGDLQNGSIVIIPILESSRFHWTSLTLAKDNDGTLHAYYHDPLNSDNELSKNSQSRLVEMINVSSPDTTLEVYGVSQQKDAVNCGVYVVDGIQTIGSAWTSTGGNIDQFYAKALEGLTESEQVDVDELRRQHGTLGDTVSNTQTFLDTVMATRERIRNNRALSTDAADEQIRSFEVAQYNEFKEKFGLHTLEWQGASDNPSKFTSIITDAKGNNHSVYLNKRTLQVEGETLEHYAIDLKPNMGIGNLTISLIPVTKNNKRAENLGVIVHYDSNGQIDKLDTPHKMQFTSNEPDAAAFIEANGEKYFIPIDKQTYDLLSREVGRGQTVEQQAQSETKLLTDKGMILALKSHLQHGSAPEVIGEIIAQRGELSEDAKKKLNQLYDGTMDMLSKTDPGRSQHISAAAAAYKLIEATKDRPRKENHARKLQHKLQHPPSPSR